MNKNLINIDNKEALNQIQMFVDKFIAEFKQSSNPMFEKNEEIINDEWLDYVSSLAMSLPLIFGLNLP